MYYALVNYVGSCEAVTGLLFGTIDDIRNALLENDQLLIEDLYEGMTREEMEEEGAEIDDFYALKDKTEPSYVVISRYKVCIGDCVTEVAGIVDNYEDLKKLWSSYVADKEFIEEWKLPNSIEESQSVLRILDDEIRRVCVDYSPSGLKFLYRE